MSSSENAYLSVLRELEQRGSYETTAKFRDISKLSGIKQLLADLGEPQKAAKIIHIAGTTGKGLTGAMLARIFEKEGFITGLYSSPHVLDIRERIVLNGQLVSKESFTRNASRVLKQAETYSGRIYLSYFDILTAIAFLVFQEAQAQWIVLETGLGGSADSTNVTEKELCILTTIGYDHINVLGNSLEAIAQEKLGIVRKGIPTVLATQAKELMTWLKKQLELSGSPPVCAEELSVERVQDHFQFRWPSGEIDLFPLPKQQSSIPYLECLKTALMAYTTLNPKVSGSGQRRNWIEAATSFRLPGRLEYHEKLLWQENLPPFATVIFDGGHNAIALQALSRQLQIWQITNYTLVLGFADDKLIEALKVPLQELCRNAHHIVATQALSVRAASPQKLTDFIFSACRSLQAPPLIKSIPRVADVLEHLHQRHHEPIVVSGSFYLVGEIFQALGCEACIFTED
ncbi:MAG: bifunctional folylpolyglutamate synthase/ dihydrofolate synthase [SAR324 cluster bacterium]|nr:bifunctional folylpolyglutamate synthase/ dihydrofolate synthase [SAR324 cluster bacterium]